MKKIALSLLAATLVSGAAVAAPVSTEPSTNNVINETLVNNVAPALWPAAVGAGYYQSPVKYVFNYQHGGDATFHLAAAYPGLQVVNYWLDGQFFQLDNDASSTNVLDVFTKSLSGGLHTLTISTSAAYAATEVSAVPLPAAALMFGSALFGAGALRRKKQKEELNAVAV